MVEHRDATKRDIVFEDDGVSVVFHDPKKNGKKYTRRARFTDGQVLVPLDGVDRVLQVRVQGGILYVCDKRAAARSKKIPYATRLRPNHAAYLRSLDNASAWLEKLLDYCMPQPGASTGDRDATAHDVAGVGFDEEGNIPVYSRRAGETVKRVPRFTGGKVHVTIHGVERVVRTKQPVVKLYV